MFTKKTGLFIIIFLLGFASFGAMNAFFSYTNTTEFCTSCHSMTVNLEEYKETIHYKNASGVRAECADCHVPKEFLPKIQAKLFAAKDVYHEFLGDFAVSDELKANQEKYLEHYDKHRWDMASSVWKKMQDSDSRECRTCHSFIAMDTEEQGKQAANKHPRAMTKGQTCIDCHKGIAHTEPDEPEEIEEKYRDGLVGELLPKR
ncbi:NapC/NirT family cytochrome c [Thiomicrorhabdus sp. Kp2]|uniref:NapC/NirT family cytochrome c n=1 Tax=Thiomicrorhabdus sp. Kp2 TaxID=1123518 RepID=UPI000425F423|nr:NapC/NirT family cytochrome c [Thiomicrorhabdus sp. Kp2]